MERPQIRWVEAMPIMHEGQEMVLIRDPEELTEQPVVVSKAAAFLISLMDGTRTLRDIQADYVRAGGDLIHIERIEELVAILDEQGLLFGRRYENRLRSLKEGYLGATVREPCLAGRSYPDNKIDLLFFLDNIFKGIDGGSSFPGLAGILAPHIDYERGMDVYRTTYRHLQGQDKPLVVVFGTAHCATEKIWSISLKDWATPLDTLPCSRDLASLISGHRTLKHYVEEWPHRSEHSIELQLPLIQFLFHNEFEILPILTGSMDEFIRGERSLDDGEVDDIEGALKETIGRCGKPYLIIAGADLAHIGAQFGDSFSLDHDTLEWSKRKDQALLERIEARDALGFFDLIKAEKDRRRICGLTPIFFQLRLLQSSACKIVGYDQWTDGKSSVSFAGAVFYGLGA
jgi:MEMO1 family protein